MKCSFSPITDSKKIDFCALAPKPYTLAKKCLEQTLTSLVQAIVWHSYRTAKSTTEVAGAREVSGFATGHGRKSHFQGSSPQTAPTSKKCPIQTLKAKTRSIVCRRQNADITHNRVTRWRRWAEKGQKGGLVWALVATPPLKISKKFSDTLLKDDQH